MGGQKCLQPRGPHPCKSGPVQETWQIGFIRSIQTAHKFNMNFFYNAKNWCRFSNLAFSILWYKRRGSVLESLYLKTIDCLVKLADFPPSWFDKQEKMKLNSEKAEQADASRILNTFVSLYCFFRIYLLMIFPFFSPSQMFARICLGPISPPFLPCLLFLSLIPYELSSFFFISFCQKALILLALVAGANVSINCKPDKMFISCVSVFMDTQDMSINIWTYLF